MQNLSKYLLIFCTILLTACSSSEVGSSDMLFPFKKKRVCILCKFKYKYGYQDSDGKEIINSQYLRAEKFSNGLGCVMVKSHREIGYGYINNKNVFVIPSNLVNAKPFHENRALVQFSRDEDWCYIDRSGKPITEPIYHTISTDFHNNTAYAYKMLETITKRGFLGIKTATTYYEVHKIDSTGKVEVISDRTSKKDYGHEVRLQMRNNAIVCDCDSSGLKGFMRIDIEEDFKLWSNPFAYRKGSSIQCNYDSLLITPQFHKALNFEWGYAKVTFNDGKEGWINTDGEIVAKF